ncbi:hypothetical protein ACS0TY_004969 [Phlomoides rotata]
MADAAISFAVEKLGDALIKKVCFLIGVEDQVRWVKDELQSMQCFLKDAAEKQGNNGYGNLVRKWISDVREVAQDAEDVIEIFTLKLDIPTPTRKIDLVRKWAGFPVHVPQLNRVGEKIKSIRTRLQEIRERRWGWADRKTTLARKIYNHPAIADRFEKRAWVVVSTEFAAEDILKLIMHELSVSLDAGELMTLESIQSKLRRQEMLQEILRKWLEGKRYFIVLDDVWKKPHWDALQTAFPNEQGEASRLLFTSRKEIFTKRQGYIHKMRVLNTEKSWELFLKMTMIGRRCPQELEDIGRKILEKCHGLPLAITIAGGLLVN